MNIIDTLVLYTEAIFQKDEVHFPKSKANKIQNHHLNPEKCLTSKPSDFFSEAIGYIISKWENSSRWDIAHFRLTGTNDNISLKEKNGVKIDSIITPSE